MVDLVRFDPFGDMMSLRQAMDHLFQDAWVRPVGLRSEDTLGHLPIDVSETGDDLIVMATVPGVRPEDVEITIQGNVLRIKGESKAEENVGDETYHRRERRFGRFQREITLPMAVKGDAAEAHFEEGVLRLRLPKAEEAKAHKIQIQGGDGKHRLTEAA